MNIDKSNLGNKNIQDIVLVGDSLIAKVLLIKANTNKYNLKVEKGDLKEPYGNDKADYVLTINTDFQNIAIRLKYNDQIKKYDILGWMTLPLSPVVTVD